MDREKKRTLFFGGILALVVIASVVYFLWGSFINKGTIRITGEAPFTAEIFEGETYECNVSPCEITAKGGTQSLILAKEGFKTSLMEVKVKILRTVDINAKFEIIPSIEETENFPPFGEEQSYSIVFDSGSRMYKLINLKDNQQRPIVYFKKALDSPEIFGSDNTALIIGESSATAYRVDMILKTRESIPFNAVKGTLDGKWSEDGKYFLFRKDGSGYFWLLKPDNSVTQTAFKIADSNFSWTYEGSLIFATHQKAIPQTGEYIELIDENSDYGFTFGEYDPVSGLYASIGEFSEISALPETIIPLSNGAAVYFQIGEKHYKLILK
ncbi:MAG: PEGA domain-containing protein [Candidatus Peregrinibacteria bacterium]